MTQYALLLGIGALGLGAILGSFVNALSFRLHTGRGMGGRSRCMSCNHALAAADLVPVFSYLYLRGRCRYCETRVSLQYPLVESVAALLSLGVLLLNPAPLAYAFWLIVWMVLLLIVVYDLRHFIIPWSCSILLMILSLVPFAVSVYQGASWAALWSGLIAGPLLALPLFALSLVSLGRWMGWGDSGLELSLGWLLGLSAGATALMLAVWSGALAGIALVGYAQLPWRRGAAGTTMSMRSEIPFAPFLVFGAALAYFCHVDFFSNLSLLF